MFDGSKNIFFNLTILLVKKIFEMLLTQKLLGYLPQRDHKAHSGI